MTDEPMGTCDGCGEELYLDDPHDCPVLGTIVIATEREES
jgi:uncharacterized protein (DUF983 family)